MKPVKLALLLLAVAGAALVISGLSCDGVDENGKTVESTADTSVPPRKDDVIVYIRGGEVWAVNPGNKAERQLTGNGTTKAWPRVSPDGKQVVYQEVMGDGATAGLFVVPVAGGSPESVNPLGSFPAWSPDGKTIACVVKGATAGAPQVDDIVLMDATDLTAGAKVLTDHKDIVDMGGPLAVQNLDYSPDGTYIYFMRGRRSDSRWLARVDVVTKQEDNVSTPPGPMPASLASGGFTLFNVSQMEGRRAVIAKGDLTAGDFQQSFQLFIRFLEPLLEDSMIEQQAGSINPSLKPDNTRFAYENGGVIYQHNLAGGPGIESVTEGSMPDWGASPVGPGFDDNGNGTQTTATTTTTGGDSGAARCNAADLPGTEQIRNGDFEQGTANWQIVDIKKKGANNAEMESDERCGQVLALTRSSSANDGGLIGLEQPLNISLGQYASLKLRLVAAIDSQSLDSDGWYGGETPVFVTVDYTTASGQQKTWTHGLMSQGSQVNYPERDQTIPGGGGWYSYNSPELSAALPDAELITKVTVGGSGWDFRSRIGLVSLKGQR